MAQHTEKFANCRIEIAEDDSLTIEGKEILYDYDAAAGKWSASYLPYTRYDSLLDLARAIAGDTVEFVATQGMEPEEGESPTTGEQDQEA